ncbi:unnamed protein product [Phytophthora fragariaefolia]|uniref:Unnamed protein product n=1 Tax=Phytophthora fragariaefolia TaxID=1490495 RepID=A0A9W7D747_9STRA|nr:unnamed protein product [Phytophthora fragariaefolia]
MTATANLGEHGLANTYSNSGARERSLFTPVSTAAGSLAYDVAGSVANAQAVAKPLVQSNTYNHADIDGTPTSGTSLSPSQSFYRLLVPTYMPNPTADHALAQKKSFRYFERMTNKFTVGANQASTFTLTNGISSPKKLFLQPIITNPTVASTVSDTINPLRSPFSTVPATKSPYVGLKSLHCTVGNIPIWNNPVPFGYDLFVQEMQASGVDGGLDDDAKECLLSQRQWESLYRFVAIDIGRRLPSEDGASTSIILSGTNNSNYAITVYYLIWRDAVATIVTAMGTVSQGATQI